MDIMLKKILCPTDFSENSEYAMKYALTLTALSQAELELFHVVEPITYPQSTKLFEPVLDEVELMMKMEACPSARENKTFILKRSELFW